MKYIKAVWLGTLAAWNEWFHPELNTRKHRDWDEDFDIENGDCVHRCAFCHNSFFGHKDRHACKECANART